MARLAHGAILSAMAIMAPMEHKLVLFEDEGFVNLLPLALWRSVFELQVGRKILLDRTAQRLGLPVVGVWTREWISRVAAQRCGAPANRKVEPGTILVNGRWIFDPPIDFPEPPAVGVLGTDVAWIVCDGKLTSRLSHDVMLDPDRRNAALGGVPRQMAGGRMIQYPWDIVNDLSALLESDWQDSDAWIDTELDPALALGDRKRLHIGERTKIHPTAVLDTTGGPIYISDDVTIGPYSVIEGPVYIGAQCRIQPHARLHGGNVIAPVCKVGGEVYGCVLHSYTNKQHAGFLGHSLVGGWVNLGAGSSNSNLKNTYGRVRVPINGTEVDSGQQFFGAVIGDHVKIGINASIATGSVIGLGSAVATTRFAPKYIPSFSWITDAGLRGGDVNRLLDAACAAMTRRNIDMTDDEVELFLELGERVRTYESTAKQRV